MNQTGRVIATRKRWRVKSPDTALANKIAQEYSFDALSVLILLARGMSDPDEIGKFLSGGAPLGDPFLPLDMEIAAQTIGDYIDSGEKIVVYGDYDADGITATAILTLYLRNAGADVSAYIPSRTDEGYGMNRDALKRLAGDGARLIVTVDNGISCVQEAEYIRQLGMELVITDHHGCGDTLPNAAAVVNPHRDGDKSFSDLCGAGIALKLCAALDGDWENVFEEYGDLAAVGTISDVVPLVGENRTIVTRGLKILNSGRRAGFDALRAVAGKAGEALTARDVSFALSPRINAAGRMNDAMSALELLTTDDSARAKELAGLLNRYNIERREQEMSVLDEAVKIIDTDPSYQRDRVLVIAKEGWPAGVVGIVAARLVELYKKPAIVLSVLDSEARGSCRSLDGFCIFDALSALSDMLVRYGGHELAAGLTIKNDNIDLFRKRINEYAEKTPFKPTTLEIDFALRAKAINTSLLDGIEILEPFGAGNPAPLFLLKNVRIVKISEMGKTGNHSRLTLEQYGTTVSASYFFKPPRDIPFREGDIVDVAVSLERNEYNGRTNVTVSVKDIRPSSTNEEELFKSMGDYHRAVMGDIDSSVRAAIRPNRKMAALIYREVLSVGNGCCTAETIAAALKMDSGNVATIEVLLDAFVESGIFTTDGRGHYKRQETNDRVLLSRFGVLSFLGYID